MRPRRMAAENVRRPNETPGTSNCFNEAAANGRGKRGKGAPRSGPRAASMRPRRMAAENSRNTGRGRPGEPGFNEAAANGRGKHQIGR